MIASLKMYGWPELADAHARYWSLIRKQLADRGVESPPSLSQEAEEFSVWTDPGLVLSQTCGMPYRTRLHEKVTLIGTPDFGVEGCKPGYYRSAVVVRRDDARQGVEEFEHAVFAYNQPHSQSGYAAPFWHLRPYGFWFENRLCCSHHVNSACAVADGRADIAALDAVSWRLMQRYDEFAHKLRVLNWTEATPGLPYIASLSADKALTFAAVQDAIANLDPDDRDLLGICALVSITKEAYLSIPNPDA